MGWVMDDVALEIVMHVGGAHSLIETVGLRSVSSGLGQLADEAIRQHLERGGTSARREALDATIRDATRGDCKALQRVLGRTADVDAGVRAAAVSALGELVQSFHEEAQAVVVAAVELLEDSDTSVYTAARTTLLRVAERGNKLAVGAFSTAARRTDASKGARQDAVEALGMVALRGDPEAVAAIVECFKDADVDLQREAAAALGDIAACGDPVITALLCEQLRDPDPTMRGIAATACESVVAVGDAAAMGALVVCLEDRSANVRRRALGAIEVVSRPDDAEAAKAVSRCFADADAGVRQAAKKASTRFLPHLVAGV